MGNASKNERLRGPERRAGMELEPISVGTIRVGEPGSRHAPMTGIQVPPISAVMCEVSGAFAEW